jgi:D-xylose transport system substrate-binding protein
MAGAVAGTNPNKGVSKNMSSRTKRLAALSVAAISGLGMMTTVVGTASAATAPSVPASAFMFNKSFSTMSMLKPIAAAGTGKIAFLLPDTASSVRWADFDAPYIKKALSLAGVPSSDVLVTNALGSDTTMKTQAQAAITQGAKVIAVTSLDPGTGDAIEASAKSAGVATIDYDRLNLGGDASVYVSFNNVQVGVLQGKGLVACISGWHVKSPHIFELDGSPTDNNATLFADGYNSVLKSYYASGKFVKVGEQAVPGWNNLQGGTIFSEALTRHPNINAAVVANDGLDGSVVAALKEDGVKPFTFPTTGQDGTVAGMQNILTGYQCGSVYKPIYLEAQAAVAAALYLRAGMSLPMALVSGHTIDNSAKPGHDTAHNIPAVLETPTWVTAANMEQTVVADHFDAVSGPNGICNGIASACAKYHIH